MKKPKAQPPYTRNQEKEEYATVLSPGEALARLAKSYPKLAPTAKLEHDGVLHWVAKIDRDTGMRLTLYVPDSRIDTRVVSVFRSSFSTRIPQRRTGGYDMWFWVCEDCNIFHICGEVPPDRDREIEVIAGEYIHGNLRPHYTNREGFIERSLKPCDACEDKTPGFRYRFHPSIDSEE